MELQIQTTVFDLDGTLYQNMRFYNHFIKILYGKRKSAAGNDPRTSVFLKDSFRSIYASLPILITVDMRMAKNVIIRIRAKIDAKPSGCGYRPFGGAK